MAQQPGARIAFEGDLSSIPSANVRDPTPGCTGTVYLLYVCMHARLKIKIVF